MKVVLEGDTDGFDGDGGIEPLGGHQVLEMRLQVEERLVEQNSGSFVAKLLERFEEGFELEGGFGTCGWSPVKLLHLLGELDEL